MQTWETLSYKYLMHMNSEKKKRLMQLWESSPYTYTFFLNNFRPNRKLEHDFVMNMGIRL